MLKLKEGESFSFKLKSNKGYTLFKSLAFKDKNELDLMVSKLKSILNESSKIERKTNHNGEFLFAIKDENGKIIGNSKCYNSEAGMENGIKNLKSVANFQGLT